MTFTPNRKFKREYRKIFKKSPSAANMLLLLCELADEKGRVHLGPDPEAELALLMGARFEDPTAYQLRGAKP